MGTEGKALKQSSCRVFHESHARCVIGASVIIEEHRCFSFFRRRNNSSSRTFRSFNDASLLQFV